MISWGGAVPPSQFFKYRNLDELKWNGCHLPKIPVLIVKKKTFSVCNKKIFVIQFTAINVALADQYYADCSINKQSKF